MPKMVEIEHKDGRRYAVLPADYRKVYEPEGGWKVLQYEDGTPYETPEEARERREAARAAEAGGDADESAKRSRRAATGGEVKE